MRCLCIYIVLYLHYSMVMLRAMAEQDEDLSTRWPEGSLERHYSCFINAMLHDVSKRLGIRTGHVVSLYIVLRDKTTSPLRLDMPAAGTVRRTALKTLAEHL